MANIDLSNFRVVKFFDADIERNYINDILHAIVNRTDVLQEELAVLTSSQGAFDAGALRIVNNLSDVADASESRDNLGLGSLAVVDDAPSDGTTYGRKDGAWEPAGGGGGAALPVRCTIYRALGTIQPGFGGTVNSMPACTITGGSITSTISGSVSIDVRVTADYTIEPGPGDSIIGNSLYNITLSAEQDNVIDVTNWATTAVTAGQRLDFYVVSASSVQQLSIQLDTI